MQEPGEWTYDQNPRYALLKAFLFVRKKL